MNGQQFLLSDILKLKTSLESFLRLPIPIDVSWKFGKIAKQILDEYESIEKERGRALAKFLKEDEEGLGASPCTDSEGNPLKGKALKEVMELNKDREKRKIAFTTEFTTFLETTHMTVRFEPISLLDERLKDINFTSSNMIALNRFFTLED